MKNYYIILEENETCRSTNKTERRINVINTIKCYRDAIDALYKYCTSKDWGYGKFFGIDQFTEYSYKRNPYYKDNDLNVLLSLDGRFDTFEKHYYAAVRLCHKETL